MIGNQYVSAMDTNSMILIQGGPKFRVGFGRKFALRMFRTILMDRQRFEETGSLMNLPHTGRPRSARKEENLERVRASIKEEPKTSTRRRSME
jgi:hypothetical protein